MIFFGHLGITTEAVKLYQKAFTKKAGKEKFPVDYRYVLAGSILPDLLDKPIGAYILRGIFHNSRIFAHTLLFSAVLLTAGYQRSKRKGKNGMFLLGIGSVIHLVLDSMWFYPRILFWPVFGWKFPIRPEGNWVGQDFVRLITDPVYWVPELLGFLILAFYFFRLFYRKKWSSFFKHGEI